MHMHKMATESSWVGTDNGAYKFRCPEGQSRHISYLVIYVNQTMT